MKFHNLEQGSPEWLEFRRCHIGASDVAAIMGLSKFASRADIMDQKLSGKQAYVNKAMRRGSFLEAEARSVFENQMGFKCPPAVVTHDVLHYMSASLDGINEERKCILELKCGGFALHEKAKAGEIPADYMCQIQTQLFVTDYEYGYYQSYFEDEPVVIKVPRDDVMITEIVKACGAFWKELCEKMNLPQEAVEKKLAYPEFAHEKAEGIIAEYCQVLDECKELQERKDRLKAELLEIAPDHNFTVAGVTVYQKAGMVTYDHARMKLDGIDLDKYRKVGEPSWVIKR